jgi:formylglycine-generating enzyme required for sulfatase activity
LGRAENAEGPTLVYLPGGTFLMGSQDGGDDEKPLHPVQLDGFALGRTPVTAGEYLRFCEATRGHWPEWLEPGSPYHLLTGTDGYYRNRGIALLAAGPEADSGRAARLKKGGRKQPGIQTDGTNKNAPALAGLAPDSLDLPIAGISWEDAAAYCQWLGEQTGEVYELPTEAQWEFACRAESRTRWCFGDDEAGLGEYAWYSVNAGGQPHPVASKKPNQWGLYDLHGNVWEWCHDRYAADYYSQLARVGEQPASGARAANKSAVLTADSPGQPVADNPAGPETGSSRVVRGGSWSSDAVLCRSAYQLWSEPSDRSLNLGFRLSRKV